MDWQWAMELGRYLGREAERTARLEARADASDKRIDRVEADQAETRTLIRRASLLLVLWGAGLLLTISSDKGAAIAALVIKALLSRL